MTHWNERTTDNMRRCKGQPLPVRIHFWVADNWHPARHEQCVDELLEAFSEGCDMREGSYFKRVWDAITTGGYSR